MNIKSKNLEMADIEMLPVESFDTASSHYSRILAERVVSNVKSGEPVDEHYVVSERDSTFQRMLFAVTGFFKSNLKKEHSPDAVPEPEKLVEQPAVQPISDGIVIRGKQQLRTLYHLLHADEPDGIPVFVLQALVGSGNQWDVVRELRNKLGDDFIQRTDFLIMNKTGKTTSRANYWMTGDSKRIAAGILARSGYVHDAASEHHHVARPGRVLAEFLAGFPGNDEDLLFVRDGTKAQWLRLLHLMRVMNGEWVSRYVADEFLDSRNVRQVVRIANAKVGGVAIESKTRTMPNRDGGVCEYGVYRLAEEWADKADKVIKDKLASAAKVAK